MSIDRTCIPNHFTTTRSTRPGGKIVEGGFMKTKQWVDNIVWIAIFDRLMFFSDLILIILTMLWNWILQFITVQLYWRSRDLSNVHYGTPPLFMSDISYCRSGPVGGWPRNSYVRSRSVISTGFPIKDARLLKYSKSLFFIFLPSLSSLSRLAIFL